jgi:hypothetical protein
VWVYRLAPSMCAGFWHNQRQQPTWGWQQLCRSAPSADSVLLGSRDAVVDRSWFWPCRFHSREAGRQKGIQTYFRC